MGEMTRSTRGGPVPCWPVSGLGDCDLWDLPRPVSDPVAESTSGETGRTRRLDRRPLRGQRSSGWDRGHDRPFCFPFNRAEW